MFDERRRRAVVDKLQIAGTRGSHSFYRIAETASLAARCPYAGVIVIGDALCWPYAAVGFKSGPISRAESLCDAAIQGLEPLVIEDLDADTRFPGRARDGVLVEPALPALRFFAAAPILYEDGAAIGALFIADDAPRQADGATATLVQGLAETAVDGFRLSHTLLGLQEAAVQAHNRAAELVERNAALRRSQTQADLAADLAGIAFWSCDPEGGALEASAALPRLMAEGVTPRDLDGLAKPFGRAGGEKLRAALDAALGGAPLDLTLPLTRDEETTDPTRWLRIKARLERDGDGARLYGCTQDVTEMRRSRENVSKLTTSDVLTGALNRRFMPVAYGALARRAAAAGATPALMVVDIDHMKQINETDGHDEGDGILRFVADLLRREAGKDALVGRIGGDQFAVATARSSAEPPIEQLSADVLAAARGEPLLSKRSSPATLSIGYVETGAEEALSYEAALRCAELALQAAKTAGRDRAQAYRDDLDVRARRRGVIFSEIGLALAEDRIEPHYQLKIDLASGLVCGLEALARWRTTDGKALPPGAFLEALEDPSLGARISERIMERALADAGRLRAAGLRFGRVAVNVTDEQMASDGFVARCVSRCVEQSVPCTSFEIEITEQALLTDRKSQIQDSLNALRAKGVTIAFDDFGTGYASLAHLRDFPLDTIKIDKSFVLKLDQDQTSRAITASLVQMARDLNLTIVAEGVETVAAERLLRTMGCHHVQGYLYGKPAPFDALVAELERRRDEEVAVA